MITNLKTYQLQFKDKLPRNSYAEIKVGGQCCYDVPSKLITIETKDVLIEMRVSSEDVKDLIEKLKESLTWEGCG